MVRVCDAIMGTGKSSAAITYINEHTDKLFIYIAPYLGEATRIAQACPAMQFYEPQKINKFNRSKTLHTLDLVSRGFNIATTHQAFRMYPPELLEEIKAKGYTLIIDENVDVLDTPDDDSGDIQMAIDAGYLFEREDGQYGLIDGLYKGGAHNAFFRILRSRDITEVTYEEPSDENTYYFWRYPPDLINAFEDVFILTYLFRGQSLHNFLKLYEIPFSHIGVSLENGTYRFSDTVFYVPEYVKKLPDMIHIESDRKLNAVGDEPFSLSMSWFEKDKCKEDIVRLKNNVYNFFRHKTKSKAKDRMWGTYKDDIHKIKGEGYTKQFVPFTQKAENKYRDRNTLAYCVNIFMNVSQKLFYNAHGIEVDEDLFALSIMVQWIWRSAIRDGKEITIYIPSRRMRELLEKWIQEVSA